MELKNLLYILLLLIISCVKENNYHNGEYEASVGFFDVTWKIDGNEILINNSVTGVSKIYCKQFPDRIEYEDNDGSITILYAQKNGDLKLNDLVTLKKINNPQVKLEITNTIETPFVSNDNFEEQPAIIKDIINKENQIYITVDVVEIEYSNTDENGLNYEIVNQNTKLRAYKVIPNPQIKDSDCLEINTQNYLINNKNKIIKESLFGFVLISTNSKGELTEINLGCWN